MENLRLGKLEIRDNWKDGLDVFIRHGEHVVFCAIDRKQEGDLLEWLVKKNIVINELTTRKDKKRCR